MSHRRKSGLALMAAGLTLMAVALLLFFSQRAAEQDANAAIEHVRTLLMAGEKPTIENPDSSCPEVIDTRPEYIRNPDMEMPTVTIEGNAYIGVLDIPRAALSLPVMSDWDEAKLRLTPCRYRGSAYLGNMILMAHFYKEHFRVLWEMEDGDAVIFTDEDQNVFSYTVTEVEILQPADRDGLEEGDWDLTLVTCSPSGQTRVVVRCMLEI